MHVRLVLALMGRLFMAGVASLLLALGASLFGASGGAGSERLRWASTDLGVFRGDANSEALALNERGQIAGRSCCDNQNRAHAFLWQAGRMTDLGSLGGWDVRPLAINEHGQIVGEANTKKRGKYGPMLHAFLWQGGKMVDLGTLGGDDSRPTAFNNRGQIIGSSTAKSGRQHAFLWQNGSMTDLGSSTFEALAISEEGEVVGYGTPAGSNATQPFVRQKGKLTFLKLPGSTYGEATGINDRGQVVGSSLVGGVPTAFLWQNGKVTDLGMGGGRGIAINNRGQVIGTFFPPGAAHRHAALWQNGRLTDLTPNALVSGPASSACDICLPAHSINEQGRVIGWTKNSVYGDARQHAFVWENGRTTYLSTGRQESQANAINNRGQIVGWITTKTGQRHAVLWTLKP